MSPCTARISVLCVYRSLLKAVSFPCLLDFDTKTESFPRLAELLHSFQSLDQLPTFYPFHFQRYETSSRAPFM
jgi:hypothetical protein